jgi:branched-chain amino acid transport system permease protein
VSNLADTKATANGQVAAYLPGGVGLPSGALDDEVHESTVEARGYWAGVWLRLKRDKLALAGAVFIVLLLFVASTALMWLVVRSSFGHTLLGIRDNEVRMRSLGYNVWAHKYIALIVSAVFAGVAGALIAYRNGFVSPSEFHLATSAEVLIMVILGGAGTLFGPMLGAFLIVLIKDVMSSYTEHWMIFLGIVYISTGLLAPEGIYNLVKAAVSRK